MATRFSVLQGFGSRSSTPNCLYCSIVPVLVNAMIGVYLEIF